VVHREGLELLGAEEIDWNTVLTELRQWRAAAAG
jgi:hypothetical protein